MADDKDDPRKNLMIISRPLFVLKLGPFVPLEKMR